MTTKKTGNIQLVFKPTDIAKERNRVIPFKGRVDLLRKLYKVYVSGCHKFFVFFD